MTLSVSIIWRQLIRKHVELIFFVSKTINCNFYAGVLLAIVRFFHARYEKLAITIRQKWIKQISHVQRRRNRSHNTLRPVYAAFLTIEGLPGVLGNKGTKGKYRREQGNMTPVLGNAGT